MGGGKEWKQGKLKYQLKDSNESTWKEEGDYEMQTATTMRAFVRHENSLIERNTQVKIQTKKTTSRTAIAKVAEKNISR